VAVRVDTAELLATVRNFGLVLPAAAVEATPTAPKATASTAGIKIYARVAALHAKPQCAVKDSRSGARMTVAVTAEATVLV
jgi:hypothetical protein